MPVPCVLALGLLCSHNMMLQALHKAERASVRRERWQRCVRGACRNTSRVHT